MLIVIKNILQYKELLVVCLFSLAVLSLISKDVKATINVLIKFTTAYAIVIMLLS